MTSVPEQALNGLRLDHYFSNQQASWKNCRAIKEIDEDLFSETQRNSQPSAMPPLAPMLEPMRGVPLSKTHTAFFQLSPKAAPEMFKSNTFGEKAKGRS